MDRAAERDRNDAALEPLAALLGYSRTRLLLALAHRSTTTELARFLHTTPSAVSQLLQRLRVAGLVVQQRQGREVQYRLSSRALRLLALFNVQRSA